jgi:hypothetical protein
VSLSALKAGLFPVIPVFRGSGGPRNHAMPRDAARIGMVLGGPGEMHVPAEEFAEQRLTEKERRDALEGCLAKKDPRCG